MRSAAILLSVEQTLEGWVPPSEYKEWTYSIPSVGRTLSSQATILASVLAAALSSEQMARMAFFSTYKVRPAVLPETSTARVIVDSLKGLADALLASTTASSFSFLIFAGGMSWL